MLGGGLLVAFLSHLKKKSLQMSDEEILTAIEAIGAGLIRGRSEGTKQDT